MAQPTAYTVGMIVPWSFSPGIVVASFFASLTGCLLTVELLHRKRLGKGVVSRLQLLACAIAMGLIGIWCMHFIGNRAIILGDGDSLLQMTYSPGYTVLSCVLPVVGLSFAFYIAEMRIYNRVLRRGLDVCSGVLAGLSVVGMHYCGNLGTTNYKLIYPYRFILASCTIAVVDCIIALMLFFYFKERWISVLWKRFLCAVLLAIGVCGMHYTASLGATYELKRIPEQSASRDTAVIVAGTLCFVAALATMIVLFFANRRDKALADRAQQVMVACAYFDDEGNIMVTNEGLLPAQKIAKRFDLQSFDEQFDTGNPVFHWIWKVSNDWESVTEYLGKMRRAMRHIDPRNSRPGTASSNGSSAWDEENFKDTTFVFRASFCVAAADLAERLHCKLDQLGTLYDRVIGTGVMPPRSLKYVADDAASIVSASFLEKGQLLFFTRSLDKVEAEHFLGEGFRFAPPTRVETMIARTMQIPHKSVGSHLKKLHDYTLGSARRAVPRQGTFLTCFAALGRIRGHFDLLVSAEKQDQLPDFQISPEQLAPWQVSYLQKYDGWSAGGMVKDLRDRQQAEVTANTSEKELTVTMINALSTLAYELSETWFLDLTFHAKPIIARYGASNKSGPAMVFGLTRLLDIHQSVVSKPDRLTFVPLDFFRLRASFFPGCSARSKFRASVHTEFASVLVSSTAEDELKKAGAVAKAFTVPSFMRRDKSSPKPDHDMVHRDSASDRGLVADVYGNNPFESAGLANKQLWGGILATTDTVITETTKQGDTLEMKSIVPRVTATAIKSNKDESTFADLLYDEAKQREVLRMSKANANQRKSVVVGLQQPPAPQIQQLGPPLPSSQPITPTSQETLPEYQADYHQYEPSNPGLTYAVAPFTHSFDQYGEEEEDAR